MMIPIAKFFAAVKVTCIFVAHFTLAQLTNTMIPEACDSLTLFIKLDMIQTVRCSADLLIPIETLRLNSGVREIQFVHQAFEAHKL